MASNLSQGSKSSPRLAMHPYLLLCIPISPLVSEMFAHLLNEESSVNLIGLLWKSVHPYVAQCLSSCIKYSINISWHSSSSSTLPEVNSEFLVDHFTQFWSNTPLSFLSPVSTRGFIPPGVWPSPPYLVAPFSNPHSKSGYCSKMIFLRMTS